MPRRVIRPAADDGEQDVRVPAIITRLRDQIEATCPLSVLEWRKRPSGGGSRGEIGEAVCRALADVMRQALPRRERLVLALRFGLDGRPARGPTDIAAELGLTRERARRLELKALSRLRRAQWQALLAT